MPRTRPAQENSMKILAASAALALAIAAPAQADEGMWTRAGRVVGFVFDGNIHSLGGDYGYDPVDDRTVAVHASALLEALDRIYGAPRLAAELRADPAVASRP
jgi:hypothetical protein